MWKIVKQPFDVEFKDPIILPAPLTRCSDGVQCRLSRPVTVGVRKKERIKRALLRSPDHAPLIPRPGRDGKPPAFYAAISAAVICGDRAQRRPGMRPPPHAVAPRASSWPSDRVERPDVGRHRSPLRCAGWSL